MDVTVIKIWEVTYFFLKNSCYLHRKKGFQFFKVKINRVCKQINCSYNIQGWSDVSKMISFFLGNWIITFQNKMTKSIESKQHIRLFQGEHVACQVQCRHGEWLNDWSACWLIWWIGLDLFSYLNPYRPKAFLTFSVILIISVHEPSMNVDCHGDQVCRNFCFSAKDIFYAENG